MWFYNHINPRLMKFVDGRWESFPSDPPIDDEIDFTDHTPQRVQVPFAF